MREIRTSGSEGGGTQINEPSLPLSLISVGHVNYQFALRLSRRTVIVEVATLARAWVDCAMRLNSHGLATVATLGAL